MASVSLRQVRKSYDSHPVVHGVDLEVADQEFVVLVAPSGCGKSTLLRMIAGLEDITDGEIAIGERVVNRIDPKDRDVAMVFQDYALYPHLTVFQNIAFSLQYRRVAKADIARLVAEAAAILDIEPLLQRKPPQLSGGQRQRVVMGRAVVREPEVFLFDEPLSNLDAKLRVQMRTEIKKLRERFLALGELVGIQQSAGGKLPNEFVDAHLDRGVAIVGQTDFDASRIAHAPALHTMINVEGNFGQNVDYASCFRRGIQVLGIAPVFAQPVTEMALGMATDLAPGITRGDRLMRRGQEQNGLASNREAFVLRGQTMGCIGCGNLGRALIPLLMSFRPWLLIHDPWLPDSLIRELGAEPASLEQVLAEPRVIFALAGVTEENQAWLYHARLQTIHGDAVFLLMSRVGIGLETGQIGALDHAYVQRIVQTNTLGPLRLVDTLVDNVAASAMRRIVLVSSRMGSIGSNLSGGHYGYRASKAGLNAIGRSLAVDLFRRGITVAMLHPGRVNTAGGGGADAPLSAEHSVLAMRNTNARMGNHETGVFCTYDGQVIPW